MRRILILVDKQDEYEHINYLIKEFAGLWRGEGMRVDVQYGPAGRVEADLAILHLDRTIIPAVYLRFAARHAKTINGRVGDISKRRISRQIVRPADGFTGAVIVKTNRNFRGVAEAKNALKKSGLARRLHKWRKKLPWEWHSDMPEYRVFSSPSEVPAGVWWNRDLVVERLLSERSGGFHCLRTWTFLGDRETHSLSYSAEPIVKSENVVKREPLGEVPPALRHTRGELGFDYGKFDYAIVDGEVVLYDANRTPALGFLTEGFKAAIPLLAAGIRYYL